MPWEIAVILGSRDVLYAYTYGLWENYRHPEVLVRARPRSAPAGWRMEGEDLGSLLNAVGCIVRDGGRFGPGLACEWKVVGAPGVLRVTVSERVAEDRWLTQGAPTLALRTRYLAPPMPLRLQFSD